MLVELVIGDRAAGTRVPLGDLRLPSERHWVRPVGRLDGLVPALRERGVRRLWLRGARPAELCGLALEGLRLETPELGDGDLEPLRDQAELRELDLVGSAIRGEGLAHLPTLHRLGLDGAPLRTLEGLRGQRELRELDLGGGRVLQDGDLAPLGNLTSLRALSLRGQRALTGEGLRHLAGLPLRRLDLSGTALDHAALLHLVGLPLEHLALDHTPLLSLTRLREHLEAASVHSMSARMLLTSAWEAHYELRWDEGYGDFPVEPLDPDAPIPALGAEDLVAVGIEGPEQLADLRRSAELYEVDLRALHGPLSGLQALSELRSLRSLSLADTLIEDQDLALLSELPLERLDLARSRVTGPGLRALPPCLERLDLSGCALQSSELAALGEMALQGLRLSGVRDQDGGWLSRLSELRSLALHDCVLGGGALSGLAGHPHLATLSLFRSELRSAGLGALCEVRGLERLDLTRCQLDDADLDALAGCSGLRFLRLSKTRVGDEHIPALRALPGLEYLGLHETRVSAEGAAILALALPVTEIVWSRLVEEPADEE